MNYKEVDAEYLKEKMNSGEYTRRLIEKSGKVKIRLLEVGNKVNIYYYNDTAQIETREVVIKKPNRILITKTIDGKEYNTVMGPLEFHKSYTKEYSLGMPKDDKDIFTPISDPMYAYEVNENIVFTNMYEQTTKLCPGDLVVPYDAAHNNFYGIYQYNFQDNYRFLEEQKYENKRSLKV